MSSFSGQPQLLCGRDDLRPAFNCVWFLGDYIWSSNAHCLLREHYEMHEISKADWENMQGLALTEQQMWMIGKNEWRTERLVTNAMVNNEMQKSIDVKLICDMITFKYEMTFARLEGIKAPDFASVIDRWQSNEISKIGLNPNLLVKVKKAMAREPYQRISLHFDQANKGMLVRTHEPMKKQVAMLMPIMMEE